jgi:uncharacterized protein (TIGR02569 family)
MSPPPREVIAAFRGDEGAAAPLGTVWRAGHLVLKRVDFRPETLWRATVLDALDDHDEFRIARPVRTVDGNWVAGGWEATRLIPGEPDVSRQDDVLRAGIAFHAALAGLERPAFLDERDNPWTEGDRVAWGERPLRACPAARELLQPLQEARHQVRLTAQAVHGDLLGNVLFADGLPPAIIDWPLYWRPAGWASAVAVVDALCWYGAPPELAARWSHLPEWRQMLIRALIYRIVTHDQRPGFTGDPYRATVHLLL